MPGRSARRRCGPPAAGRAPWDGAPAAAAADLSVDEAHHISEVEDVFRQTKDDEHLAIRPQYHWTDQKIHVHTFICLLGLILARIVEWESRKLGRKESLSAILDLLGSVRLVMILRPSGKKGGRPRCQWQLEEADPGILEYFLKLVPHKAPFVYTPPPS